MHERTHTHTQTCKCAWTHTHTHTHTHTRTHTHTHTESINFIQPRTVCLFLSKDLSTEYSSSVINLVWVLTHQHVTSILNSSRWLDIFLIKKWAQRFWICHTLVTLNEGQDHSNSYQYQSNCCHTREFRIVFLNHTKFKRNGFINRWHQAAFTNQFLSLEYKFDRMGYQVHKPRTLKHIQVSPK